MFLKYFGLAAIAALVAPATLLSQIPRSTGPVNRAPDKNATHIMIPAFTSAEKGPRKPLGSAAAEEMRRQVAEAFSDKPVYVVPVELLDCCRGHGQFDVQEGLEPHDAKALAIMLRADEYVFGSIVHIDKTRFRGEADLVLTRDLKARQPLGVGESPKMADAIKVLVKEMKEARKQMDGEQKCTIAAREGKYAEAIEFANAAIVLYPKATLARLCLLSALNASKAPTAEVLKVARELVALDPRSNVGLAYLADEYRGNNQSDSLVMVLTQMVLNDPRNSELVHSAEVEISARNPGLARVSIDSAIALNPNDLELLKTRWTILYAARAWPEMRTQGAQIVRLDTAFADMKYFQRTALSFAADSQWQQAAAVAAQGVAKFPGNTTLVSLEIQFRQRAGQPR